jgi:hypothetical protein
MKSDTTATVLNFVLAVLVVLGVVFALLSITRTRELRLLTTNANVANQALQRAAALANDTAVYNNTAKSPELARLLQSLLPKNAPATR